MCTNCYGNGFTIEEEKSDNERLRKENKKFKKKIQTLEDEMVEIISKMKTSWTMFRSAMFKNRRNKLLTFKLLRRSLKKNKFG